MKLKRDLSLKNHDTNEIVIGDFGLTGDVMVGPIMTARKAVDEYGDDFSSITRRGGKVRLKNTSGRLVTVDDSQEVYHRGRGRFGIYSEDRDKARHRRGAKETVGSGRYRQTSDKRKRG